MGTIVANNIVKELATLMDCSKADVNKVEEARRAFVDITATRSGIWDMLVSRRGSPRGVRDSILALAMKAFPSLISELEEAGCRPKEEKNCS
jgi:hypothetical protein